MNITGWAYIRPLTPPGEANGLPCVSTTHHQNSTRLGRGGKWFHFRQKERWQLKVRKVTREVSQDLSKDSPPRWDFYTEDCGRSLLGHSQKK